MAPAYGKNAMARTLQRVTSIDAHVRVFVAENDPGHVQIAYNVTDALSAAGKHVSLTIYPPYRNNGHELFFVVHEPYWSDLLAFLGETIGHR